MARTLLLCALFSLLLCAVISAKPARDRNGKNFRLVCYLGSWAYYRHGAGKYTVEDIDPYLCTHLVYGFTKLENDRIAVFDPYLDLKENWGLDYYSRFNSLRRQNPELTTIVAIGGWNEGSIKYSEMARDPSRRRVFIQSVLDFLKRYNFDGLDFDWEYPASRDSLRPEDKENFVLCLKELKEAFAPFGYVLTAAVSAGKRTIEDAYDIPKIAQYLDFVNLMAYDYHGSWDKFTGHNAPLYARPDESEDQQLLNVNFSVNYWLSHGTPRDKLVLGMPLYGRCLRLSNPDDNGLGAPVQGAGMPGPFTNEPGMIGFNELCDAQAREGNQWTVKWDDHHMAPYAYKGHQWCGFDNQRSIGYKVDYLKSMNLGGGMVWSLETDDFRGHCFGKSYPLLWALHNGLSNQKPVVQPTVKPRPTESPQEPTTVSSVWCTEEGIFGFVGECKRFYQCVQHFNSFRFLPRFCPPGTAFDHSQKHCTQSHLVAGCGGNTPAPVTQPPPSTTVRIVQTTQPPVQTTKTPILTTKAPVQTTQAPVVSTSKLLTTPPVVQPTTVVVKTTNINEVTNSPSSVTCTDSGTFVHPTDCRLFYKCQKITTGFKVWIQSCPGDLVFNPKSLNCDYIRNVQSCQK